MSLKINVNYNIQIILIFLKACNRINLKIVTVCLANIMYKTKKQLVLKNVQNATNKYQVLCNFSPDTFTPAAVSQPLREFICVQRQK